MTAVDKAISKYLSRYAQSESALAGQLTEPFSQAVAIAAFAEGADISATLESLLPILPEAGLCIIVVNAPEQCSAEQRTQTRRTVQYIHDRFALVHSLGKTPPATLHTFGKGKLLLIERHTEPWALPGKGGVGEARKIAADLALSLHATGKLQHSFLHCTDADVIVPYDYFQQSRPYETQSGMAALVYPFTHHGAAAERYEISLRYYVLGLRFAGSPYAFHTIGSTLALHLPHYAKVRGFPKRQAGEDFYILNKLAKVGNIRNLSGNPLVLSSRPSNRVPFGTGKAVMAIKEGTEEMPLLYHPEIFTKLRDQLNSINSTPRGHEQFDAFRTLKWIHAERKQNFASLPFREALHQAPFIEGGTKISEMPQNLIIAHLSEQEKLLPNNTPPS